MAEHREHQVATRVHVVDRHEQLAKSRLPQIVRQQFDVLAPELGRRRRGDRRGAANQIPQLRQAPLDHRSSAQRRAEQTPHGAVLRPPFRPRAQRSRRGRLAASAATPTSSANSTSRGITVGSAVGANSASTQALKLERSSEPGPCEPDQRQKEPDRADRTASTEQRKRHGEDDARRPRAPSRRREAAGASHRSGPRTAIRQMPSASHSLAPPSTAAKKAPMAPTPRPADEIDLDARLRGARGARRRGTQPPFPTRSARRRCAAASSTSDPARQESSRMQ